MKEDKVKAVESSFSENPAGDTVSGLIRAGAKNLINNHKKAFDYGLSALKLARENGDVPGMIKSQFFLADITLKKLSNSENARAYLKDVVTLATEIDDKANIIEALTMIGTSFVMEGNHKEALRSLDEAQLLLDVQNDIAQQAAIYAVYGTAYLIVSELDKALEYNLKCIEIGEYFSNKTTLGNVHNNNATIYYNMGRNEEAIKHFLAALELYSTIGDKQGIVRVNTNISQVYSRMEDLDKSLEHASMALDIAKKIESHRQICICLNNMGDINKIRGENDEALKYFIDTYEKAEELNLNREAASGANNIGDMLTRMGKFTEALTYLDIGLEKAKAISDIHLEMNNSFLRAMVGELSNDYKFAYIQLTEFVELKDKMINEQSSRRIDQLKTKYDTEKKERDTEIFRLKNIELAEANTKLKDALERVKVLSGLVPICAHCSKIRDDKGFWNKLEKYISEHSDATFSHGICPDCMTEYYPKYTGKGVS